MVTPRQEHRHDLDSGRSSSGFGDWLPTKPAWQADAVCKEHPEVDFFPPRGASALPAIELCRRCAVQAECLAYALSDPSLVGVWGATTTKERRRLRNQTPEQKEPTRAPT